MATLAVVLAALWGNVATSAVAYAATGDVYAVLDTTTGTLTFKVGETDGLADDATHHYYTGFIGTKYSDTKATPWASDAASITKVDFEGEITPTSNSTAAWFRSLANLTSVEHAENLKMDSVTNMSYMFAGCTSLENVGFASGWDVSKVQNMSYLFDGCTKLMDVRGLATWTPAAVTTMEYMFENCTSLTQLDLSGWVTPKLASISYMCRYCTSLAWASLAKLGGVLNGVAAIQVFRGCSHLTYLDISGVKPEWSTSGYYRSISIFQGCSALRTITFGESFYEGVGTGGIPLASSVSIPVDEGYSGYWIRVDDGGIQTDDDHYSTAYMMDDARGADRAGTWTWERDYYTIWDPTDHSLTFDNNWDWKDLASIQAGTDATGRVIYSGNIMKADYASADKVPWHAVASKVAKVNFNCRVVPRGTTAYWFAGFTNPELKTIDLSRLGMSYATSTAHMFEGATGLRTLTIPQDWNTTNVTSMSGMFRGCTGLRQLDVTALDTSKVTDMANMFSSCTSLRTLDVSNFNTSRVTYMNYMFRHCTSLTSLDLHAHEGDDGVARWDVSKVTTLEDTFLQCYALETLDVSGWQTDSLTNMWGTFAHCESLTELNLWSWDTTQVDPVRQGLFATFGQCYSLSRLWLGPKVAQIINYGSTASYYIHNPPTVNPGDPYSEAIYPYDGHWNKVMTDLDPESPTYGQPVLTDDGVEQYVGVVLSDRELMNTYRSGDVCGTYEHVVYNSVGQPVQTISYDSADFADESMCGIYEWERKPFHLILDGNEVDGVKGKRPDPNDASLMIERIDASPDYIGKSVDLDVETQPFALAGHVLDSWNTAKDGSGKRYEAAKGVIVDESAPGVAVEPDEVVVIYAQWVEDVRCTVTFDAQGGAPTPDAQVVYKGQRVTRPTAPTKSGGIGFTGWYTEAGEPWDFDVDVVAEDMTLYAHWGNELVVRLDANGSGATVSWEGADEPGPGVVVANAFAYGAELPELPEPAWAGHRFVGWYDAATGGSEVFDGVAVNSSMTLYAHWKVATMHLVTFDANGGARSVYETEASYDLDAGELSEKETLVTQTSWIDTARAGIPVEEPSGSDAHGNPAPTRSGYALVGWNTQADGTGTTWNFDDGVTEDLTLYAQWKIAYTVRLHAEEGAFAEAGDVTEDGKTKTLADVAAGTKLGEIAGYGLPALDHYHFDGWYAIVDAEADPVETTDVAEDATVTGNVDLYATYAINTHTLTVPAIEHATVTVAVGDADAVTVGASGFAQVIPYGTAIEIVVAPDAGWEFTTGSAEARTAATADVEAGTAVVTEDVDDETGVTTVSLAMPDADTTTTAAVEHIPYTIVLDANGHGAGFTGWADDQATYYVDGDDVELPSLAGKVAGWTFEGWEQVEVPSTATIAGGAVKAGSYGDVELRARWTRQHYSVRLEPGEGTGTAQTVSGLEVAEPYTFPARDVFAKYGHYFAGWKVELESGTLDANVADSSVHAADEEAASGLAGSDGTVVVLTAQWTANNHNLLVEQPTHVATAVASFGSPATEVTKDSGAVEVAYNTPVTLAATADFGYHITGWVVSNAADATDVTEVSYKDGVYTFAMPDHSVIATPQVAPNVLKLMVTVPAVDDEAVADVTVSYVLDGADPVSPVPADDVYEVPYSAEVTVGLTPHYGYQVPGGESTVDAWTYADLDGVSKAETGDDAAAQTVFAMPNNDAAVTPAVERRTYTVSFDSHGGTSVASQSVLYLEKAATPDPAPTKEGHTFAGWYADDEFAKAWDFDTAVTGDMTLHAKWTVNSYQVTFVANGGELAGGGTPDPATVDFGSLVPAPGTLSLYGHTFAGWYESAAFAGEAWDFAEDTMPARNVTLHAKWDVNRHTMTVVKPAHMGDAHFTLGEDDTEYDTLTVAYGTRVVLSATAASYYEHTGWEVKATVGGDEHTVTLTDVLGSLMAKSFPMPDGDVVATPLTKPIVYSVTLELADGSYAATPAGWEAGGDAYALTGGYTVESDDIAIPTPARVGYDFAGWVAVDELPASAQLDNQGAAGATLTAGSAGDVRLRATWTEADGVAYTVRHYKQELGSSAYELADTDVRHGVTNAVVAVAANAEAGWAGLARSYEGFTFAAAYAHADAAADGTTRPASGAVAEATILPDGSRAIDLYYARNRYRLTVSATAGATTEGSSASGDYWYGEAVSLAGAAEVGYAWEGWASSDDSLQAGGAGGGLSFAMPAGDLAMTATAAVVTYDVSYDLGGGALAGGAANPATYTVVSDAFTLANPARPGYGFAGWTGTGLGGATTEVTVPTGSHGDRAYAAAWDPIAYSVTLELVGGSYAETPEGWETDDDAYALAGGYTIESDDVEIPTPKRHGYVFAAWAPVGTLPASVSFDGKAVRSGSYGDVVLKAVWTPRTYEVTYDLDEDGGEVETGDDWPEDDVDDVTYDDPDEHTPTAPTRRITVTFKENADGEAVAAMPETPQTRQTAFVGWKVDGRDGDNAWRGEAGAGSDAFLRDDTNLSETALADGSLAGVTLVAQWAPAQGVEFSSPTRAGYDFVGWNAKADGTGADYDATSDFTTSVTLYAQWERRDDTAYAVRHYLQELGSDAYELADTDVRHGVTGSMVAVAANAGSGWAGLARDYEGFTFAAAYAHADATADGAARPAAGAVSETTILADGSRAIDLYYVRNAHRLTVVVPDHATGGTVATNPQATDLAAVPYGTTVSDWTVAPDAGYYLLGWTYAEGAGGESALSDASFAMPDADVTIAAQLGKLTYRVSIDLDGGSVPGVGARWEPLAGGEGTPDYRASYQVTDESFSLPTPVRRGYDFAGWTLDDGEPKTAVTVVPANVTHDTPENVTYVARWTPASYAVSLDLAGGTLPASDRDAWGGAGADAPKRGYHVETSVSLPVPVRVGYDFVGWSLAPADAGATTPADYLVVYDAGTRALGPGAYGDLVATAAWTPRGDTAWRAEHWLMNLDGTTYALDAADAGTGETGATVTPPVRSYVGFTAPAAQTATIAADGSTVVRYEYARNRYQLTVTAAAGSTAEGSTASGSYYFGAPISLSGAAKVGYAWEGWASSDAALQAGTTNARLSFAMPAGDLAMTATARLDLRTLVVPTPDHGRVSVSYVLGDDDPVEATLGEDGSTQVPVGAVVTVVVTPDPFYRAGDWTGTGLPSDRSTSDDKETLTFAMPDGDATAVASVVPDWTVTYDAGGGTFDNGSHSVGMPANEGGTVGQPGDPVWPGHEFDGWFVVDDDGNEVPFDPSVPTGKDVTVVARWTALVTVTFDTADGTFDDGTTQLARTVRAGMVVGSVDEPTRFGYDFIGWYEKGSDDAFDVAAPVYADATVYARWTPHQYQLVFEAAKAIPESVPNNVDASYDEEGSLPLDTPVRLGLVTLMPGASDARVAEGDAGEDELVTIDFAFTGWKLTDAFGRSVVLEPGATFANLTSIDGDSIVLTALWQDGEVELPTPTRSGYRFVGWRLVSVADDDADSDGITPSANASLDLALVPQAEGDLVSYEGDGLGTRGLETLAVSDDDGAMVEPGTYTVNRDMTLVAVWEKEDAPVVQASTPAVQPAQPVAQLLPKMGDLFADVVTVMATCVVGVTVTLLGMVVRRRREEDR